MNNAAMTYKEECEALRAEVERLKTTPPHKRQDLHCVVYDIAAECRELRQQLAASQLEVKRLLESVDQYIIENDPSDFGCACDLSVGYLCGPCFAHMQQTVLRQALSSTASTEALDAYVDEKVKQLKSELASEKQDYLDCEHMLHSERDTWQNKISELTRQRDLAVSAIENLVKQKGRHNTEIAYKKLVDVLAAIKESES